MDSSLYALYDSDYRFGLYTNNDGEVTSFIGEDTGVKNNIYASRFCDHDTGTCWNLDGTIYVGSALHLMPNIYIGFNE